jgi:tetratricopeptide (TPR) repeat protein
MSRCKYLTLGVLLGCLVLGSSLLGSSLVYSHDNQAHNYYERGRFEYSDGQYEQALSFFDEALKIEPGNTTYLISRGQTLMKLKRYEDAEAQFERLLSMGDQAEASGYVELGALYGQTKRYGEAAQAYGRAIELTPNRADLYLARGAMYLEMGDDDRAEAEFRLAAEKDPNLAAASDYQLALVSFRREDLDETNARLDEALQRNPDEALASHIRGLQANVAAEKKARKKWAVLVNVYGQYDDNVSQSPLDGFGLASAGTPTTDKHDFVLGTVLQGRYFLANRRAYNMGFDYTFRGMFYQDLTEFDMMSHTLGWFFAYNSAPWYFHLRTDFGYYYSDYDDKMFMPSMSPGLVYVWGDRDRTEILGFMGFKDMRDGTDDVRRYVLGATHYHTFLDSPWPNNIGLTARGGVRMELEDPVGERAARYVEWELLTGLSFPLPAGFYGDVGLRYAWINYNMNALIDPLNRRRDQRLGWSARVGRSLGDYVRVDLSWDHTYNNSNLTSAGGTDIYQFRRNVYTLMFTGSF